MISQHTENGPDLMESNAASSCTPGLSGSAYHFQPVADWQISLIVTYVILLTGISAKKAILAMC